MVKKKVLILEDEESIRSFVSINLKRAGYETVEFGLGEQAVEYMQKVGDAAICVLDVMLPDTTGFEVCRKLRAAGSRAGIIMLTALGQENDRVTGLMTGADDYVTKPFSVTEFVARVDAIYRRIVGGALTDSRTSLGKFSLDAKTRELIFDDKRIELTQVEYLIVKAFLENPDKALSRDDIMTLVWGKDYHDDIKVIDVNIRRLRLKVEEDPAAPKHIVTVWGFGYKWKE